VIVGAGLADAKAAQALREEGYEARIVLLGAERERPYERPPLSKEHLRGEAGRDKICPLRALLRRPRDRASDRDAS
jgi:3-phenylpropionate/trans-cinnamate dioxygenase ferredoxin reductase subunit